MAYSCRILADSITAMDHRLTSFEVTFPRFVLAEFNTHRVFTRSSASSRAIPVEKQLQRIHDDPFVPFYWGKNQRGMQADEEIGDGARAFARSLWLLAAQGAVNVVSHLLNLGIHKQLTNRLLEPWMWHTVIVTSTEWSNFFALRCDANAQPEIREIATRMQHAYAASTPLLLEPGEWHLPLVTGYELQKESDGAWTVSGQGGQAVNPAERRPSSQIDWLDWAAISVGRCARVSYLTHDGRRDLEADRELTRTRLVPSGHMAPLEHAARPMTSTELELFKQKKYVWAGDNGWQWNGHYTHFLGNVQGFVQYRKLQPHEDDFGKIRAAA